MYHVLKVLICIREEVVSSGQTLGFLAEAGGVLLERGLLRDSRVAEDRCKFLIDIAKSEVSQGHSIVVLVRLVWNILRLVDLQCVSQTVNGLLDQTEVFNQVSFFVLRELEEPDRCQGTESQNIAFKECHVCHIAEVQLTDLQTVFVVIAEEGVSHNQSDEVALYRHSLPVVCLLILQEARLFLGSRFIL